MPGARTGGPAAQTPILAPRPVRWRRTGSQHYTAPCRPRTPERDSDAKLLPQLVIFCDSGLQYAPTRPIGVFMYRLVPRSESEDLGSDQIAALGRTAAQEMARRAVPAVVGYMAALAVLLGTTPYAADHPVFIMGALVLAVPAALLRLVLLALFNRVYDAHPRSWLAAYIVGALAMALSWGLLNAVAIQNYGSAWTSLVAGVITAGICLWAVLSLSMNLALLRSYLALVMLPTGVAGFLSGTHESISLALVFLTGLGYMLLQSRNVNAEYWAARVNSVRLDRETRRRLHTLTYHDPLTDLPNRVLFGDRLDQALNEARRRRNLVGVLFVGLDRFKNINDTLGHHVGDELLKEVAARMSATLRDHDTISRLSGDTFAVVVASIRVPNDIARVGQKLRECLGRPFDHDGLELFLSASIGMAVSPLDSEDPEILASHAEAAMYRVKQNGGNAHQFYEATTNAEAMERLQLEAKLRRALERDEFILHYQPKIALGPPRVTGFEALIRWCPPGSDPVSPAKFIPLLEDTGLIVPIGEWVLRTACAQNKAWQDAGFAPVRMAVNLSARQFRDQGLADMVARVLDDTGLDPRWLELEITESMLMEHTAKTMKLLERLHDMGVQLAIDDFGTGYSSLTYLKRMPIHTLKIDRSFVKDITTDPSDAAVVEAVIAMAHKLKLQVVAEGVETPGQVVFLRDQSCDEMQGFFFSRPMPAEDLVSLLQRAEHLELPDLRADSCA